MRQLRVTGVQMQICVKRQTNQEIKQYADPAQTSCWRRVPCLRFVRATFQDKTVKKKKKGNVRKLVIKTEQSTLQAPDVAEIPDPVHKCQLRTQD